jgi:23S rRNA pseudouridine1911/1915/1917 synthase
VEAREIRPRRGVTDDDVREFVAADTDRGQRLDVFVARVSGLSRARVQALLGAGRVLVNGLARKPRHQIRPGERVELTIPPVTPLTLTPEAIPLDILYEDDDLLVLNKPPGLAVHPGAGRASGTLVHALLAHCPHLPGIGGVARPGIVHRLDRDTSGVMVVAKTERAHLELSRAFKGRRVQKRYLALVHGELRQAAGRIEAPIGRRPRDRQRMGVRQQGGRDARTAYRVVRRLPGRTLVEASPETGRTHQIRVHLAHLGHPVVGDQTYGGRRERRTRGRSGAPGRQMLHAWRLGFHHPVRGAWLEFTAPIPDDLAAQVGAPIPAGG